MSQNFPCLLGLSSLETCFYDPKLPPHIYFSFGEVIAATALLIALTQLLSPIKKFRLSNFWFNANVAYVFLLLSIIFIFVSHVVPILPLTPKPVIGYPVFWELLAGIFVTSSIMGLIWGINRQSRYEWENCAKYFNECFRIISKGNDSELIELSGEIRPNVKKIVNFSKQYHYWEAKEAKDEDKPYYVPDHVVISLDLLNLLSDEKFCRLMVIHNPFTVVDIFRELQKGHGGFSGANALVQEIINQALINPDSILYRENKYSGLGHWKGFTQIMFGNDQFNNNFNTLLQPWGYWKDEIHIWQIEAFENIATIVVEAYFQSGRDFWQHSFALNNLFRTLDGISLQQTFSLKTKLEDEVYQTKEYEVLSRMEGIFKKQIELGEKYSDKLPIYPFNSQEYDSLKDSSFYGFLAKGIYDFFERLSSMISKGHDVRTLAIGIWLDIFTVSEGLETPFIKEIQKRLQLLLFDKVKQNLNDQYYPPITALLIDILGLYEQEAPQDNRGAVRFRGEFFDHLRNNFEASARKNKKKALDMLPKNVEYDQRKGQLIENTWFGEKIVLDLRYRGNRYDWPL